MLSSVLNSPRAVAVNIQIMRAFVRLRQLLASNAELARRLDELEMKYDAQFKIVFDAIRQLTAPPAEFAQATDRLTNRPPGIWTWPNGTNRRMETAAANR